MSKGRRRGSTPASPRARARAAIGGSTTFLSIRSDNSYSAEGVECPELSVSAPAAVRGRLHHEVPRHRAVTLSLTAASREQDQLRIQGHPAGSDLLVQCPSRQLPRSELEVRQPRRYWAIRGP